MKTFAIIATAALLTGCASKPAEEGSWKSWSLFHHLETRSEWGATQGGISARLLKTEEGIVLVIRNDGPDEFAVDPFFEVGDDIDVEAYDENRMALADVASPIFVTRGPSTLVRLKPGAQFASSPINDFDGKYAPPSKAAFLVAVWHQNLFGSQLRGPVVTGPLSVGHPG